MMDQTRLEALMAQVNGKTVGVLGDFCLDAYWMLDAEHGEFSVETGKPVMRVEMQGYFPGGASNVAANLATLGLGAVRAFGVLGPDLFGWELRRQIAKIGVDCAGLLNQEGNWSTPVFAKPHLSGEEQNRLDFGTTNEITPETEDALVECIKAAIQGLDALVINQQLPKGYHSAAVIEALNRIAEEATCPIIVDSRHKSLQFRNVILKVNRLEASGLFDERVDFDFLSAREALEGDAASFHQVTGKPVVVTRGERGMAVYDGAALTEIPGIQVAGRIDPVGAGDTVIATIAALLAAGAPLAEAAEVANIAASVTVGKVNQTGTASPEEILAVGAAPNYVHLPELAEDIRRATYLDGTDIEIFSEDTPRGRITHAIFDHDGTISTLREGWESVMQPMMLRAVLGGSLGGGDEKALREAETAVRALIDHSTGMQTMVQMEALTELVREFMYVPEEEILTPQGYKDIYNAALMERVRVRTERVARGELSPEDWQVKGVVPFLESLRARGVKLYLASGTDVDDVRAEAELLGYAPLFEGRIFGAVGDVSKYSKRMVIDQIIREHGLKGPELIAFGDGPVEIRETKRRGGVAVGIASDEVRGFGLNPEKRSRLIRAGADLIIPDYSQAPHLLAYLFEE